MWGRLFRAGAPVKHRSTPGAHRREAAPVCIPEWRSPAEHADMLLDWLQASGFVDGAILATHLMLLYREACEDVGWLPRAWNPVGRAVALRTTGGKKIYVLVGGRRVRA